MRIRRENQSTTWRWPRVLAVAVLLLGGVTWGNIILHGQSRQHEVTRSQLDELTTSLHEESALQWKTLADLNSPVRVARELGTLRASESVLMATLSHAESLETQISAYHAVLDQELGLLGVGKTAEALTLEYAQTDPQFSALDTKLRQMQQDAEDAAGRANTIADLTLVLATLAALAAIGVLLFRFEREHRASDRANAQVVAQQRLAIDVLAENEALIRHQASHDPLTGLPNRRLLAETIEAQVNERQSVLLIDLDNFKPVNDELGHAAGDELLVAVAGRLLSAVRAEDTVARLGGDEFAVVVADGGVETATDVASRIVKAVAEPFVIKHGVEVRVGASVGVAVNLDRCDGTELLRRADAAMYDAKRTHKGSYALSALTLT